MRAEAVAQILAELAAVKAQLATQTPRDRQRLHDARSAARLLGYSVATFYREVERCPTLLARAGVAGTPLHTKWLEGQLDDYVLAKGDEAAARAAVEAAQMRRGRRAA